MHFPSCGSLYYPCYLCNPWSSFLSGRVSVTRIPPSRFLPLVGDEKQLGVLAGLELPGTALATEVVTNPQRVAVPLVDGLDRLALVGSLGAGDVQRLRLHLGVQLDGALVDRLADG